MPVFPNTGTHENTSYRVPDSVRAWVEAELADYLNPQHWDTCKEKDGKTMWKKNLSASGVKESSKLKHTVYWKFSAVIPDATVSDIYDIMHQHGAKYQTYLTEGFLLNELVEVIPESRRGNWCEEAVVQYRAFKLPIVNNRDFLTLTIQKNFTTPSGLQGIGLFSRSVPDYPVEYPIKKGFTRADLISCNAFLLPAPNGCHYSYTQRANLNMSIPIPNAIAHYAEKSHIWRHFEVMKKCVALHHENITKGLITSPPLDSVTMKELPPTLDEAQLAQLQKDAEAEPTESSENATQEPSVTIHSF